MKRMLSGIKPTGQLHLGSYIGALHHFVEYQDQYEMFAFIANLHCITVPQEPEQLKKNLYDCVALYLACGLDPNRATIFLQTDVKEHAQLGYIMCCNTYMGELNPIRFNGAGETLFVDDSIYTAGLILIDALSSLGPQTARFAGNGARMTVVSGLFADATDRAAVHDFTLLFEPASGGYTNGPVLFSSSTGSSSAPLGTMRNAGSTAKFRVVVDPARMRQAGAKTARGFAVAWKAGLLEQNVVLVPGEGYTLRFTYGWDDETDLPLALDAPANEGDLPTGVWFEAPSKGGTVVIVR